MSFPMTTPPQIFDRALRAARRDRAARDGRFENADYLHRAAAYEARGELPAATRDLERALELLPDNAQVHTKLAAIFLLRGDLAAALPLLDKAVGLDPGSSPARASKRCGPWVAAVLAGASGPSSTARMATEPGWAVCDASGAKSARGRAGAAHAGGG